MINIVNINIIEGPQVIVFKKRNGDVEAQQAYYEKGDSTIQNPMIA